MSVFLGSLLLAGCVQLLAPEPAPPVLPDPPATQGRADDHDDQSTRATRGPRESREARNESSSPFAPADDPVERRRNRARYLQLVDLRDPFSSAEEAPYGRARQPYLLPDLKDPFLLAARPRSAWRGLPPLPGDIRDPFDTRSNLTVCTSNARTRAPNGVRLQRPRSLEKRKIRTKCVTAGQPFTHTPPDLQDPFPPGHPGHRNR